MRNWNISCGVPLKILIISFYSTYEELKLLSFLLDIPFFFSFYSTYEELKHIFLSKAIDFNIKFLQYLWGIETEYFYLCRKLSVMFLQYLWGIETAKIRIWKIRTSEKFLQYLWGIETHLPSKCCQSILLVFTVPMRNWNRDAVYHYKFS